MTLVTSWGRCYEAPHEISEPLWLADGIGLKQGEYNLAHGCGRSYGDSCLNTRGHLIRTTGLDRFIEFDAKSGVVRCEAGVTLDELLRVAVPKGFFLPVTPGTTMVTVGGAIANDVHGKNHHRSGTFGRFVTRLGLLRSDGFVELSPEENADLFNATIGGLGLTGLITWGELRLKPIANSFIDSEEIKFGDTRELLALADESDKSHEYTVAWADWTSETDLFGRGIFIRGNHSADDDLPLDVHDQPNLSVPDVIPTGILNSWTMRLYNSAHFHRHSANRHSETVHYSPFFYPLDHIQNWNRLYGPKGFFQFQCVLDENDGLPALEDEVRAAAQRPFLNVIKRFGDTPSPGLLSFPRRGITVCLDYANRGASTEAIFRRFHDVVRESGGAIYPAKDAFMTPDEFAIGYPNWRKFTQFRAPAFLSDFWRRTGMMLERIHG